MKFFSPFVLAVVLAFATTSITAQDVGATVNATSPAPTNGSSVPETGSFAGSAQEAGSFAGSSEEAGSFAGSREEDASFAGSTPEDASFNGTRDDVNGNGGVPAPSAAVRLSWTTGAVATTAAAGLVSLLL